MTATRFRHRPALPDLPKGAERQIVAQFKAIENDLDAIRGVGANLPALITRTRYDSHVGELVRVAPPAAGLRLTIPTGRAENISQKIRIAVVDGVLSPGVTVSIVGGEGTINGLPTLTLTSRGLTELTSLGPDGWSCAVPGSSGSALPPDGVYGEITVTGAGTIWTVTTPPATPTWAQVLAAGAVSGASNPIVDVGQFLQLGLVGPALGQIRSGDAVFRIHGGAQLSLIGDTNLVATASGGAFQATGTTTAIVSGATGAAVSSSAGAVALGASTNITLTTNGTLRATIEPDGSWNIGGSNGSAGNVLTSNGAAAAPTWQAPAAAAVTMTDATITLPYANKQSDTAVVVDAAIGVGSRVGIFWGTVLATDVNDPEADEISFTCTPAAGSMTVRVSAVDPLSLVGGPYKIRYLIG